MKEEKASDGQDAKARRQQAAQQRQQLRPLKKQVETLEKQLAQCSDKLATVEDGLGDDALYTDPNRKDEMNGLLGDQARLKKQHDALEGELLDAMEALEIAESELGS